MKHNPKITFVIIFLFLITQLIGIYVADHYSTIKVIDNVPTSVLAPSLPFNLGHPEVKDKNDFLTLYLPSIIFAFVLSIILLSVLSKLRVNFVLRIWFLIVIVMALTISIFAFLPQFKYSLYVALAIAIPLAILKIFKRDFIIHNFTELLIYPGVATVFIPILNIYSIIILLVIISIYDMWAVWHSKIMQKMAKYQINNLKIFPGFFLPHMNKETKALIKKAKKSKSEKKELKLNVAILGGGDIIFPILASGVALKTFGFMTISGLKIPLASLLVVFGALLGLMYLLFFSKEKKFYPAMPFISAGIFLGMAANYLILRFIT